RDVRAHLRIDGRPSGDATIAVGPNQSADVTFAGAPRGTVALVSVDDAEGLAADNERDALVSTGGHGGVLIVGGTGDVSRDAYYVRHALAVSQPGARAYDVAGISGAALATVDPDSLLDRIAIVIVSTRGLERKGREALAAFARRGGGLFVAAGPDV